MKLVLMQPPIQDFYHTPSRLLPLGLAYLKAAVRKFLPGVEVVVKDFHQGWGSRTLPWPKDLEYLKDYYGWADQSPFSTFHHFRHFGASFEALAEETVREKPDLVGISALFTPYLREVGLCASAIKQHSNIPVVLGGSLVSVAPERMLNHPDVDWVVRGEGEKPLVALLTSLLRGRDPVDVPGVGYKQGGRPYFNPIGENYSLEELPQPDFSDFPLQRYALGKRPLCFLVASRGCPHRCSFCSVHQTFGQEYRRRPFTDLVQEIDQRYREGYRVFDFEDDNLTYDRAEMLALCRHLEQKYLPGDIRCLAMNGISFHSLDRELLRRMRRAHFTDLNLSLVSRDPRVCRENRRPHDPEHFVEMVREARRLDFRIISYQILGLPGEPLSSMLETLRLAARLPVLVGASPFYLIPGTPAALLFPPASESDLFRARLTALAPDAGALPRDDIYTLLVTARIINFFKGFRWEGQEITLPEALEIAGRNGKRVGLGVELFRRLICENRLYAATREGWKPLSRFRVPLFLEFWHSLGALTTQEGKTIIVNRPPSS